MDCTGDGFRVNPKHSFGKNKVMPFGANIAQSAVGVFEPSIGVDAYISSNPVSNTIFNLLAQSQGGSAAPVDIEYLIAIALGQNALPTVGDVAYMGGYTLGSIKPNVDPKGLLTINGTFGPRGRQTPLGRVLCNFSGVDNAVPTTVFDHGANAAGTTKGGGMMTHVLTPTGTAATGNIGVPTQPVATDTVVVNGVTFTWVAAVGSTAGNVLIGSSALVSAQNLYDALTAGKSGAGTTYIAVTAANQALVNTATYSQPSGANNTISITYKTTGTAGNAFTLTKTGTGGLTVSAATLTGGVAGDALTIAWTTATSSGGSYTAVATSTLNGTTQAADYVSVPVGTVINEYSKVSVTGGAGQTVALLCVIGRFFSQ